MNKIEIIVKPAQSGKTFVMLQEISKMLEIDDDTLHIIFCDNQLLMTEQTSNRIDNFEDLETYSSEEGDISLILSSRSKIKKYSELTHHICGNLKTIITCSNKKRVEDINKLINYFSQSKKLNDYNFSIWIDEIDKNIKLFKKYLIDWDINTKVKCIGLITATPGNVLKIKEFETLKIFELRETYNREIYHSFGDSYFKLLNYYDTDIETYIKLIMTYYSNLINCGQVWFIPSDVTMQSHDNIKNILLEKDFIVIMINSSGKNIYYDNYVEQINTDTELAFCLGDLYIDKKLSLKKVAITGNLCINRGITINSEKMLITHAIFPTKITNPSNSYQLAGRVCGNIKKFENYKIPTIFCNKKFKKIILEMETRAMNLAEKAFNENRQTVTSTDYKNSGLKSIDINKNFKIFDKLKSAIKFGKNHLDHNFNEIKKIAPKTLMCDNNNPSAEYVISRWWGISKRVPARLIPLIDNKFIVYWNCDYIKTSIKT